MIIEIKLGAAGDGVFFTPEGSMEFKFAWGLGNGTNNMAEALALWQGLRIAGELGISELIIIGDSRVVIRALVANLLPTQLVLRHLLHKIVVQASLFTKIDFYHVLRDNNPHADLEANKGASLSPGELFFSDQGAFCSPPIRPGAYHGPPRGSFPFAPPRVGGLL